LREDPKKGVFVEGLRHETVADFTETMNAFVKGANQRTTAETRLNERSSRSHAIFSITVEHDYMPKVTNIA